MLLIEQLFSCSVFSDMACGFFVKARRCSFSASILTCRLCIVADHFSRKRRERKKVLGSVMQSNYCFA